MGMFDEVLCNHELFGAHKGETYQTKDLHCLGGLLNNYEITLSGRLEFLEYTVEDRSDPNATGIERMFGRSQHTNLAKVSWSQSHPNHVTWSRRIPSSCKAESRCATV